MATEMQKALQPPGELRTETKPVRWGNLPYVAHEAAEVQVLHIKLYYWDGSRGELNITSPSVQWGEDIERQYLYMRMYLRKSAPDLGIVAYQANIVYHHEGELKVIGRYEKVDCTLIPPFKPGQHCDHD